MTPYVSVVEMLAIFESINRAKDIFLILEQGFSMWCFQFREESMFLILRISFYLFLKFMSRVINILTTSRRARIVRILIDILLELGMRPAPPLTSLHKTIKKNYIGLLFHS